MSNQIRVLTDREHVLLRPAMYIGATDITTLEEYILEDDKIVLREVSYVPALIKIVNELIDNSVDVAIKSNFKSSNKIDVKITPDSVEVRDNGTGIPVKKLETGEYMPMIAWGSAKAGSNFGDDEDRTSIGMNGVGSFASNCFSKEFVGVTDDGTKKYEVIFKNNASEFKESIKDAGKNTGTKVTMKPDLERFSLVEIDETHMSIIQQRLINLSLSYPEIKFSFNGKRINVTSFKKYVQMFNPNAEVYETDEYSFAILPNPEDDFRQFSYVNGLKIPDGGTHIDIITRSVVDRVRDKLARKFKSIKPADIRNKLMVIAFLQGVPGTKFNSQSKEKITNSISEINNYFNTKEEIPFDALVNKILKNKEIIDPITEIYRIKEEFKKRQELKALNKPKARIRSDKYLAPIGKRKYLFLAEGNSAASSIMSVTGRQDVGYFILRGKPLNSWSAPQSKFTSNEELSLLYQVIQNEEYDYIVFATDQDLDGYHIRGLLLGFILKYLPEYKDKIGMLQTPIMTIVKNKKLVSWSYSLGHTKLKSGESVAYKKGLGSWKEDELKEIIQKDGLNNLIQLIDMDDESLIEDWLGKDSEPRKGYILENDFSIAKA